MSPDSHQLAKKVLEEAFVMSLGIADESGPWVADVVYVYDGDFNLYWISRPDARHSRALGSVGKAACTIHASWETHNERALQIEGRVEKIEGPMFELEKKLEAKRGTPEPRRPGEILAEGLEWYKLTPDKIFLIHSKPFDYERQAIR